MDDFWDHRPLCIAFDETPKMLLKWFPLLAIFFPTLYAKFWIKLLKVSTTHTELFLMLSFRKLSELLIVYEAIKCSKNHENHLCKIWFTHFHKKVWKFFILQAQKSLFSKWDLLNIVHCGSKINALVFKHNFQRRPFVSIITASVFSRVRWSRYYRKG